MSTHASGRCGGLKLCRLRWGYLLLIRASRPMYALSLPWRSARRRTSAPVNRRPPTSRQATEGWLTRPTRLGAQRLQLAPGVLGGTPEFSAPYVALTYGVRLRLCAIAP
jgi:hypothetical protein